MEPYRWKGEIVSVYPSARPHGGYFGEIRSDEGRFFVFSEAATFRQGVDLSVVGTRVFFDPSPDSDAYARNVSGVR